MTVRVFVNTRTKYVHIAITTLHKQLVRQSKSNKQVNNLNNKQRNFFILEFTTTLFTNKLLNK